MFRRANQQDKRVIFDLYAKQPVIHESQDDYFNCSFIAKNTIVNEINGHVVASLQHDYHKVMFNDLPIVTSVIFAQFSDRTKGSRALENLRAEAIKQESYKTLFTFINCDNNKEYQKYGFDAVYYKRAYSLNKKDFKEITYSCVSKDFNVDELLRVYRKFTEKFTGYFYRDRDKKEVDFIIESVDGIYPIEIKKGTKPSNLGKNFHVLNKFDKKVFPGIVIDNRDKIFKINDMAYEVPIELIGL